MLHPKICRTAPASLKKKLVSGAWIILFAIKSLNPYKMCFILPVIGRSETQKGVILGLGELCKGVWSRRLARGTIENSSDEDLEAVILGVRKLC